MCGGTRAEGREEGRAFSQIFFLFRKKASLKRPRPPTPRQNFFSGEKNPRNASKVQKACRDMGKGGRGRFDMAKGDDGGGGDGGQGPFPD